MKVNTKHEKILTAFISVELKVWMQEVELGDEVTVVTLKMRPVLLGYWYWIKGKVFCFTAWFLYLKLELSLVILHSQRFCRTQPAHQYKCPLYSSIVYLCLCYVWPTRLTIVGHVHRFAKQKMTDMLGKLTSHFTSKCCEWLRWCT